MLRTRNMSLPRSHLDKSQGSGVFDRSGIYDCKYKLLELIIADVMKDEIMVKQITKSTERIAPGEYYNSKAPHQDSCNNRKSYNVVTSP